MIRHGNCLVVSNLGEEPSDRARNDPCEPAPKPSPCASRHNLTVHLSCDEAASWRALGSTLSAGTLSALCLLAVMVLLCVWGRCVPGAGGVQLARAAAVAIGRSRCAHHHPHKSYLDRGARRFSLSV